MSRQVKRQIVAEFVWRVGESDPASGSAKTKGATCTRRTKCPAAAAEMQIVGRLQVTQRECGFEAQVPDPLPRRAAIGRIRQWRQRFRVDSPNFDLGSGNSAVCLCHTAHS